MTKKKLIISTITLLVFALTPVPFSAVAISVVDTENPEIRTAETRNPILFVHGFLGSASNWDTMRNWFMSNGYPSNYLYAYTFNNPTDISSGSNEQNAREVSQFVDYILSETGASEVDIIAHSMGGLSTRWYIKYLGGASKVDDYVSLGAPHHGTFLAFYGDMRIGSLFLLQLNSGDETPSGVDWTTIRSSGDGIVIPTDTAMLDGADNNLISGVGHIGLLSSSSAFNIAYAAVND